MVSVAEVICFGKCIAGIVPADGIDLTGERIDDSAGGKGSRTEDTVLIVKCPEGIVIFCTACLVEVFTDIIICAGICIVIAGQGCAVCILLYLNRIDVDR